MYSAGSMQIEWPTSVPLAPPIKAPQGIPLIPPTYSADKNIIKHCKEDHLPATGRTIRIGSLYEYRGIENRFIQDSGEGTFSLLVNFSEPTVSSLANLRSATLGTIPAVTGEQLYCSNYTIFQGARTTGTVSGHTQRLKIEHSCDGNVKASGSLHIASEIADCYILCFTYNDENTRTIQDPAYNSFWTLPKENIFNISDLISCYLANEFKMGRCFTRNHIGSMGIPPFTLPRIDDFSFGIRHSVHDIIYRERLININETLLDENVYEITNYIDNSPLIKPLKFRREREVRFIFQPFLLDNRTNLKYLPPYKLQTKYMPCDTLLPFIGDAGYIDI